MFLTSSIIPSPCLFHLACFSKLALLPNFEDLAQNSLGQEKDDKQENDAENKRPIIGNRADKSAAGR
jgi:hypothetical protein